jgi:6-phosphogluconolactonase
MTLPRRVVVVLPDARLLAESTASRLLLALLDAQSVERPVHVVVTGGTVGIACLAAARRSPLLPAVDLSGVHVWWGDERFLPTGDPERNETQAREALLGHVPIPPENIHAIPGPDVVATPEEAADAYAAELARFAQDGSGTPSFAVLMLGVGPDGHVASLFPGLPGVEERERTVVAAYDCPKPPPERVSLTLPAIANAHQVWLVAAGEEKADRIAQALAGAPVEEVPAAGVEARERTVWLLDVAAAGLADTGPAGREQQPPRQRTEGRRVDDQPVDEAWAR